MNEYEMDAHPTRIQAYGLDALITGQDDPLLWETALRQHWPAPGSPDCLVDSLRFNTGRCLAEGEQPQGEKNELHASMRGMVDIEEWCFERIDETHLRVKSCPPPTGAAPAALMFMDLAAVMSGKAPVPPPAQTVFIYLGISRPSRGTDQAVVFSGSTAPGVSDGAAYLWQKDSQGRWQQTDHCLTRWFS